MGFEIGESKLSCFRHSIALEDDGEIRALHLVDAEGEAYAQPFKGTDLAEADFESAKHANVWRVDLSGADTSLLLTFEDERLERVKRNNRGGSAK